MSKKLPKRFAALAALIERLHTLPDDGPPQSAFSEPTAFFQRAGEGLMLTGDEAVAYWHVVEELTDSAPAQRHGRGAVEGKIQDAILSALNGTNFAQDLTRALAELQAYLSKPAVEWIVLLPVSGIDPQGVRRLGSVRFLRLSPRRLGKLRKQFGGSKEIRRLVLNDGLGGATYAESRVMAVDSEAAKVAGRRQAQTAIDVANFYADFLAYGDALAYLPGERSQGHITEIAYVSGSAAPPSLNSRRYGPLQVMPMREVLDRAKPHSLASVSRLLSKASPSEVERRVIHGIEWLGRAAAEIRPDNALLAAVIALEAIVIGPAKEAEIGLRLRLRCAKLLAKRPANRARVARNIADIYGLRSRIAHTGLSDVPAKKVELAKTLARGAVLVLLRNRRAMAISKNEEFERWMTDLLLK